MHVHNSRLLILLAACALIPIIAACGGAEARPSLEVQSSAAPVGRASGSLKDGASSPRELVERVLESLAARDTASLASLLVDRDEYMRVVYPELGAHFAAARDTRAETMEFLWENQSLNALKGMRKALRELGGVQMQLVTIEFKEGERRFPSYRLFEGTEVVVNQNDGRTATLYALGTMIEKDGRYKLMSFRDLD